MPGQHTEYAFETAIEHYLTTSGGYEKGDAQAFDRERCLAPGVFPAFVRDRKIEDGDRISIITRVGFDWDAFEGRLAGS